MPKQSNVHIHTLVQFRGRKGYWRCDSPTCTSYMPEELVVDKQTLCTLCGAEMILDREARRRVRPRCTACSETKEAVLRRKALALTKTIFENAGTD